jgi:hypothetical protein
VLKHSDRETKLHIRVHAFRPNAVLTRSQLDPYNESCATALVLDRNTLGPGDHDQGMAHLPARTLGDVKAAAAARIGGSGCPLEIHTSLERGPSTQVPFRSPR